MRYPLRKILGLILFSLIYTACGPSGNAPGVPEPEDESYDGTQNSGDLASDDSPAQDGNSPTDALRETRLATLPGYLSEGVEECEKAGRFFDIGQSLCTEVKPVDFPCRVDEAFLARLDKSTLKPLKDYLKTKVKNLQLYACTEQSATITLHFFRFKANQLQYRELDIAKATPTNNPKT